MTVVMLYHNECASLRFLTRSWRLLPTSIRDQVRLLIIDDHSQIPACQCVENSGSDGGPGDGIRKGDVTVVRIENSRPWNIGGARNLGAFLSCSPYLLVADMDALISEALLLSSLTLTKQPGAALKLHQFNRHFTNSNDTAGAKTKFHPGMMLVARDAYWANHGCDEDFVGHYGQTDPHFRGNFVQRPGHRIEQHPGLFMCMLRAPADDPLKLLLPSQSRDTAPNLRLLRLKQRKKVPWNHTVLRFQWRDNTDACPPPLDAATDQGGKARERAAALMRAPLLPEHAFSTRSWGKTDVMGSCSGG